MAAIDGKRSASTLLALVAPASPQVDYGTEPEHTGLRLGRRVGALFRDAAEHATEMGKEPDKLLDDSRLPTLARDALESAHDEPAEDVQQRIFAQVEAKLGITLSDPTPKSGIFESASAMQEPTGEDDDGLETWPAAPLADEDDAALDGETTQPAVPSPRTLPPPR